MPAVLLVFLIPVIFVLGVATGILRLVVRAHMKFNPPTLIDGHIKTLARKRSQLVSKDDYGIETVGPWIAERSRFIEKAIFPQLSALQRYARPQKLLARIIEARVLAFGLHEPRFNKDITPIDYEHYCAAILRRAGWSTQVTQASGDQGADVIAISRHSRILLQCKLHNHAVGNKAVQEASAARMHYGCDDAAVVTSISFTQSAKRLAASNKVTLLHHDDLAEWAKAKLFESETRAPAILSA